jgi:hypothetical protein
MINFILGFLAGVAVLCFVANRFADKAKPQAEKPTINAISMDVNGNSVSMDAWHAKLMADVIRNLEGRA